MPGLPASSAILAIHDIENSCAFTAQDMQLLGLDLSKGLLLVWDGERAEVRPAPFAHTKAAWPFVLRV